MARGARNRAKGLGRDQRRIAERDQEIVHTARDGIARRQHRMRGAEPFGLHEGERVGANPPGLLRHRVMVGTDHDSERGAGSLRRGGEHMGEQALACHGMQHFWQARSHARAFAGGEHNREA
ncbi:hypothetical protein ACVWXO_008356 [Bradyrhizobium sp. LM2.7]